MVKYLTFDTYCILLEMNFLIHPIEYELNIEISSKVLSITAFRCISDAINVLETMRLMLFQRTSMGSRSGEYVGKYTNLMLSPEYGDYTTIWHRIHDLTSDLDIAGVEYARLGTDGTGMKTNNAGSYRITKYGDPDARKKKHLVVIITAHVRTKKIIGIESHIEGSGQSEPEAAGNHMRNALLHGVRVRGFYGDGAFDTNDLFEGSVHHHDNGC